ncbi:hypothetical protein PsorP6_016521 [Peronosclerospora sorghi]|uniref:Uncharacterized protein n=1 Tax=Peronosclerospora sorghi TaxID=230839 RepID=A0ACC0VL42_9STRA|nr:hypothetical protein PsorP6_016521 [Peronosclerospora sorghi]
MLAKNQRFFICTTDGIFRSTRSCHNGITDTSKPAPLTRKPLQPKRSSTKSQRVTTPVLKTPTGASSAEKTSRSHFSYTPYTGPLPPLTVESSFAPKGGQVSDRRLKSASPTQTKKSGSARKSRPPVAEKAQ